MTGGRDVMQWNAAFELQCHTGLDVWRELRPAKTPQCSRRPFERGDESIFYDKRMAAARREYVASNTIWSCHHIRSKSIRPFS